MKKNMLSNLMIQSLLALLVTSASVHGAASLAGAVHAAVPPPPPPPPPPSVSASVAARASTAASTAATTGAVTGAVNGAVQPAAATSAVSTGVNTSATTHASAVGEANGASVATQFSGRAAVTLDVDAIVQAIHTTSVETRETVTSAVQARIEAGEKLMGELKARSEKADEQTRADFNKARIEADAKARQLRADLKTAMQSKDVSSWGEVQSTLSADYAAYGRAVASAEASFGGSN
ncbi:MAG: hypothetical protein ABUL65_01250 [Opitutus sp.]